MHVAKLRNSMRELPPGLALAELDAQAQPAVASGSVSVAGWASALVDAWRVFGLGA
jgi:hypothetical protein